MRNCRGAGISIYTGEQNNARDLADAFRSFFTPNSTSAVRGVLVLNIGHWFNLAVAPEGHLIGNDARRVINALRKHLPVYATGSDVDGKHKKHAKSGTASLVQELLTASGTPDPCANYSHSIEGMKNLNNPFRCE